MHSLFCESLAKPVLYSTRGIGPTETIVLTGEIRLIDNTLYNFNLSLCCIILIKKYLQRFQSFSFFPAYNINFRYSSYEIFLAIKCTVKCITL